MGRYEEKSRGAGKHPGTNNGKSLASLTLQRQRGRPRGWSLQERPFGRTLWSADAFLWMNPIGSQRRRRFGEMVYRGQPPAAQTRLENGSGRVSGKWLAQLNLWPGSFYTCNTIVLLKFEMYSQRNCIESHSREITDSLSCSQMTLWKSDALLPELVTVVFHLKYDMFQAANLPCQMVKLKCFWWQRRAAGRLPVSSILSLCRPRALYPIYYGMISH